MPTTVRRWRENLYTFSTFVVLSKHGIHWLDVFLSYARSYDPDAGIGQLGLEILAISFYAQPAHIRAHGEPRAASSTAHADGQSPSVSGRPATRAMLWPRLLWCKPSESMK